jgi:AcrR family transcriptional regulator
VSSTKDGEKLLATASKAFARHGFAAISVDEIAESAGFQEALSTQTSKAKIGSN